MTQRALAWGSGLLVVLLSQLSDPARALAEQAPPDTLRAAELAIEALDYDGAARTLERLRLRPSLPARDRNRALELLGACRVYLGERRAGLAAFEALLSRDPGHRLASSYPPRVRAVFYEALASEPAPVEVVIERADPPAGSSENVIAVRVTAGESAVDTVRLRLGPLDDADPAADDLRAFVAVGDVLVAELPEGSSGSAPPRDAWIDAVAPSGQILAGMPLVPVASPVEIERPDTPPEIPGGREPPPRRPWYRTWWFWTVVGVAVAGAAVTTAVVVTAPEGPRDGRDGTWEIW